ncbi:MAG: TetR/AcrR family transcriptional regulator [Synergistaceae bacterium]|nr:TetR/AcrR family transcriptional regulator [Synergistaceae bacterium]
MARKTKEMALETRKKLLESALDVMSEKPFNTVSIDEIASRIGLSKGAVYWHFKNKNDLLIHLIRYLCEKACLDFNEDGKTPEDFEGLRRFFHDKLIKIHSSERLQKINRLLRRHHEWSEEANMIVMELISEMTRREREMVKRIISQHQERHEVRTDFPAHEIATLLSAIFHGMFFFQLSEIFSMDFAKYTDFIFDALEKELRSGDNVGFGENAHMAPREDFPLCISTA